MDKFFLRYCTITVALNISIFISSTLQANPITIENLNTGSRGWVLSTSGSGKAATDPEGQIKGYMSATSVNKGGQINLKVSVNPVQNFTIEIYRTGWYGGNGGRLMQTIGPIAGNTQPACPRDEATGLIECNWATSYTLNVPTTWTSGIYLAKLKNAAGFDSGTIFVVRDDSRLADFLYKQPVNTYQAYNQWPEGVNGKGLYNNILGETMAYKVSYNRPYAGYRTSSNGYGDFPLWELQLVKWLEKEGYDIAYNTDVDFQSSSTNLLNYRGLISPGHDEYWSKETRDSFENARSNRVNLAFFGANAGYWQVRLEPAATDGVLKRTLVCYKSSSLDPITNLSLKTDLFRSAAVNRPEQNLMGLQYISYNNLWNLNTYTDFIVKNSAHWAYQGTGLADGQPVPKLVGYEIDTIYPTVALPSNTEFTLLAESPFLSVYGGNLKQNSVIYKTPQDSWVFSAGTMSWSWALDYDFNYSYLGDRRSTALQTVTKNILNRFANRNNIINNGSFESPRLTKTSGFFDNSGSIGWQSNRLIELQRAGIYSGSNAAEGSQWLELNSVSEGSREVYQTVPTTVGKKYVFSFAYSPRPRAGFNQSTAQFGDQSPIRLSGASFGSMNWKKFTNTYVATSNKTIIRFRSLSGTSIGNLIDDVVVVPVSN